MAMYCIGDVQGCNGALDTLLKQIDFSASRDTVFLLGDLVNRGPDSLGVLRRLMTLGASAKCLLGNHDLHFLASAHGVRMLKHGDTVQDILDAPDREALIDWVQHQHMAMLEQGVLMVHAGVLPSWDVSKTIALSRELETVLRGNDLPAFLLEMYGNKPFAWRDGLSGIKRLRVIVNALTRLRFCTQDGEMEFDTKEGAGGAPVGYMPWFEVPGRLTEETTVAFGHWSTLGLINRPNLIALDTGCVWGGCLSAINLATREVIQTRCAQAQKPG
jgi:bis(5'-nucleosyl)-tetraphosphatase (symmetrical)